MDAGLNDEQTHRDEIERIAAEWVVRIGGAPLSPQERIQFEEWIARSCDHRSAYDDANATWSAFDVLKQNPGPLRAVIAPPKKAKRRLARGAALVAALLICGLLGLIYQLGNPWIGLSADYRTAAAELRSIQLPDGSTVDLAPESAIAVEFSSELRRVRLLAGEAFFSVIPRSGSEQRAFSVAASGGTTTALGTQFIVEDLGDMAAVTAVEHRIEVALPTRTSPTSTARTPSSVVLSPGQTVRYSEQNGLGPVAKATLASATAWRQGMLVFDAVPLGEVVAKLNRYRRGRIIVMDSALARRQVSGVFPTGDLTNVVDTIATELGARAVSAPPFLTLLY
jgi:transmembrane sensor